MTQNTDKSKKKKKTFVITSLRIFECKLNKNVHLCNIYLLLITVLCLENVNVDTSGFVL